ncbi:MAG: nucleoside-diphosphate-sugar epimerase [Aequorivita sp.]|nr:nucleoside-diphosphate-sugar epimerase [Aequorivita sp.]|tara:strand:+ start:19098 stop:19997 length:900 start_codon:yes stop_codon:yes gene_type:complete
MNIIITGASGFVGKNLSNYLIYKEYQVQKLSLRDSDWKDSINLNADAIIHLAGIAHDTSNTSEESLYFQINRDLTISVFKEFLKSDINDFFFFSSVKAAADSVDNVLDESIVPQPKTAYGKSKNEAEEYLLEQHLPPGKRIFIIRPTMIHGPGNKGNLNLLYNLVRKEIPWPLASFDNRRSFLSINNLSFLILKMLTQPQIESGIYNFADDETISTNKLISIIALSKGKKPKLWQIPAGLINNVAKIGNLLPLPLNSERLKKLTESYVVSNQKIKTALGIKKLPLTAEEGLQKTIKSFK